MNLTKVKKSGMRRWLCVLLATGVNACVTINIYFPAAAAEKAADKVIDEIWQVPTGTTPASDQPSVPTATPGTPAATPAIPTLNPEHAQ